MRIHCFIIMQSSVWLTSSSNSSSVSPLDSFSIRWCCEIDFLEAPFCRIEWYLQLVRHSYVLQTTENSATYQPSTIDNDAAEANCSKNNRSEFHCCLFDSKSEVQTLMKWAAIDVWLCQDSRRQQPAFAAARSIHRTHHVYSNTTTATHHIITPSMLGVSDVGSCLSV